MHYKKHLEMPLIHHISYLVNLKGHLQNCVYKLQGYRELLVGELLIRVVLHG